MRNEGPVYGNRKPQRLCAYLPVGKLQAGVGVKGRSILTSTTNEGCGGGTQRVGNGWMKPRLPYGQPLHQSHPWALWKRMVLEAARGI